MTRSGIGPINVPGQLCTISYSSPGHEVLIFSPLDKASRDGFGEGSMRRRDLVVGLLLAPLAMPVLAAVKQISILHSGFPNLTPIYVLIEALRALGYENGTTAAIETLGGEGDAKRLGALVAGLASKKSDVIIALTSPAVLALKQAGVGTPVVFAFVTDPVRLGIIAGLAHPGGNFTGVTFSVATLGGKRLGLLLEALPDTRRVAVIWSRSWARVPPSLTPSGKRHRPGEWRSFQRVGGRARPRPCLRLRQRLGCGSCHFQDPQSDVRAA